MCKQCMMKARNVVLMTLQEHSMRYQAVPLVDSIEGLESLILQRLADVGKCPAMKGLEDLTTMNYEFNEDPTICFEYVKAKITLLNDTAVRVFLQRDKLQLALRILSDSLGRKEL